MDERTNAQVILYSVQCNAYKKQKI